TVSLRDLIELTILESDNVAANILLDKVGLKQVNATLQSQGFADTRFERRFLDTAAQQRGAENWTTAEDLAGMLLALWNHELFDPKISTRMLALLKQRGEQDPDWLGRGLPKNVTLYHINGTLDRTRNDAGIVELAPDKGYILVICQDGLSNELTGERNIV